MLLIVSNVTVDELIMPVSYSEYAPELADQCAFNIACLANVKETDFEYFAQDDFRCRKPDIVVKVCTSCFIEY